MNSLELFSIIGALFELSGIYFLSRKNSIGFILNSFGGILWISFSITSKSSFGLLIVCPIAILLNIKGFYNWNRIK